MSEKIGFSFLASVLALGISSQASADVKPLYEMNPAERRAYFKPDKSRVKSCPMDDDNFWSHWATERGYEQLFHGNLDEAAKCYEKAGEMYRRDVAKEHKDDCFVCDGLERVSTILKGLPDGAIDIRRETFEESARNAESVGNRKLAAELYELTALGYSLELEGYYGRFTQYDPIHRERTSWPNKYLKASEFLRTASELISRPEDKRRILRMEKAVNHALLTTGYCSAMNFESRQSSLAYYPECQQAKTNFDRLDKALK